MRTESGEEGIELCSSGSNATVATGVKDTDSTL